MGNYKTGAYTDQKYGIAHRQNLYGELKVCMEAHSRPTSNAHMHPFRTLSTGPQRCRAPPLMPECGVSRTLRRIMNACPMKIIGPEARWLLHHSYYLQEACYTEPRSLSTIRVDSYGIAKVSHDHFLCPLSFSRDKSYRISS